MTTVTSTNIRNGTKPVKVTGDLSIRFLATEEAVPSLSFQLRIE